ncbi:MAG: PQQ-like beta-propeller repeat protein [Treponema sp.]|nr:PQQ-like beta-propeller repeat protein [Treponema sp.]
MKSKKYIPLVIILTFIFILIYVILAVKPLGKDYKYNPEWKININNPTIKNIVNTENQAYFKLGQAMGYFTDDGDISYFKSFPSKAAISDYYFAPYSTDGKPITFYDNFGNEKGILEAPGFPRFYEDRIYVFEPGGNSFVMADNTGKTLWSVENTIPITAFSSKKKYTAVGYANGIINVINNSNGQIDLSYAPGGSDYPVILGLDISEDGQYIASISGHNRQRFVLSKRENNQPKIIYHDFLSSELYRPTIVQFCKNDTKIIYNYEAHLGIYDINTKENRNFNICNPTNKPLKPFDVKVLSIEETDNLILALGKNEQEYTVFILENTDTLIGQFTFEAETAFIRTLNNDFYIGKDSSISKISLHRE